jgi:hypothetical protein
LKLDHQLNQLVLAQALQISSFHEDMDSEIGLPGKGARKSGASPPIGAPKMAVGNCSRMVALPLTADTTGAILGDCSTARMRQKRRFGCDDFADNLVAHGEG